MPSAGREAAEERCACSVLVVLDGEGGIVMLDRDESALHAVQLSLRGRALLDDASLIQNRCFLYHLIGNGTGEWRAR